MATYSITNDTLNGVVDTEALADQILSSDVKVAYSQIGTSGDVLTVNFKAALDTDDQNALDAVVASHDGQPITRAEKVEMSGEFMPKLPQGGKKVTFRGFQFQAAAGTTTTFLYQITEPLFLKSGVLFTDNNDHMDTISFDLTDEDNLLGYGSGFVLHKYVKDFPVFKSGHTEIENEAITEQVVQGFYIKITYLSNGSDPVNCNVGMRSYS